ncbi:MAG: cyclic nucleotide-binding domain-containing protein, partial [Comamonadaceae bacterium]
MPDEQPSIAWLIDVMEVRCGVGRLGRKVQRAPTFPGAGQSQPSRPADVHEGVPLIEDSHAAPGVPGDPVVGLAAANVYPLRPHAARQPRPLCTDCRQRAHCLPAGVSDESLELLDRAAIGRRRLRAGQVLYAEGGTFRHIYAVYSGTFKSASTSAEGREQVTAFSHRGDILGLSGLAGRAYGSTVTALEDSEVCAIAFEALRDAAGASSDWRNALCQVMGSKIVSEHVHALVLANASTEARVAFFLLQVSGWML